VKIATICLALAFALASAGALAQGGGDAMEKLRANIRDQNVHWWLSQFLKVCGTRLNHTVVEMPAETVA